MLVHAAAGGVGQALLQVCQIIGGVRVIGTASASKHDMLHRNGCAEAIDYRSKDYVEEARRLTGDAGVDVVFDCLGGADEAGYGCCAQEVGLSPTGSPASRAAVRVAFCRARSTGAHAPVHAAEAHDGQQERIRRHTLAHVGRAALPDLAETVRLCREGS